MLKEKKELINYLRTKCNGLVFNQEKLNKYLSSNPFENYEIFKILRKIF